MYTLSRQAPARPADTELDKQRIIGCMWVFAFQCLIMTMPTLKLLHLFGADDWRWRWITLPFWGPGVLLALLLLIERTTGFRKVEPGLC